MPEDNASVEKKDLDRKLRLQRKEFEAVADLAQAYTALPAVVDDDYELFRGRYEKALKELITALLANHRLDMLELKRPPDEDRILEQWFNAMHDFGTQGLMEALEARGKLEDFVRILEARGMSHTFMRSAPAMMVLETLAEQPGYLATYAAAARLTLRKGQDYNRRRSDGADADGRERDEYFPFGELSYAQMVHVKSLRLRSLALSRREGLSPQFEGLRDTALDLMNYCAFFVDWLTRQEQPVPAKAWQPGDGA